MSLSLPEQISQALQIVDAQGVRGRRLLDGSQRLCRLVHRLLGMGLIPVPADVEALEPACAALQLTLREGMSGGERAPMTLKDRVESAGEMLISLVQGEAPLLDRTVRLLRQVPQRQPTLAEARLLADAVNLEDFGISGVLTMMTSVTLAGDGVTQLAEAWRTKEQYGYWDARLARFHFPAVREIARVRLDNARKTMELLGSELPEAR